MLDKTSKQILDLLALIISVLAFVGAYRHEISAILRLVMQALIK